MGKFVVSKVKTGYVFTLKAGNGEVIGTSEVYASESSCLGGIDSVRNNCGSAVEDQTVTPVEALKNPKYELYTDKAGEFRYRLKAKNGEIILSGEGYKSKSGCKGGIDSVKSNAPKAEVEK